MLSATVRTATVFYTYEAYADIIDEILRKLISMGKGIEVNTAGFKYGLGHPNPTEAVLLRYHELGGEILTLGADAHVPEHVAYAFDRLPQILRHAGFRYFTVFTGRKPDFLPSFRIDENKGLNSKNFKIGIAKSE